MMNIKYEKDTRLSLTQISVSSLANIFLNPEDQNSLNYNSICYLIWVWDMVLHSGGRTLKAPENIVLRGRPDLRGFQ
jgi:hypothetical protein